MKAFALLGTLALVLVAAPAVAAPEGPDVPPPAVCAPENLVCQVIGTVRCLANPTALCVLPWSGLPDEVPPPDCAPESLVCVLLAVVESGDPGAICRPPIAC